MSPFTAPQKSEHTDFGQIIFSIHGHSLEKRRGPRNHGVSMKWLKACNCFQNLSTKRTQTRDRNFVLCDWKEGRIYCDGVSPFRHVGVLVVQMDSLPMNQPVTARVATEVFQITRKSPSLIPKWMYKAFTITTTFHWGPPNVIQLGLAYFRKQKDLYLHGAMNCLIMWLKLKRLTCLKSLIT